MNRLKHHGNNSQIKIKNKNSITEPMQRHLDGPSYWGGISLGSARRLVLTRTYLFQLYNIFGSIIFFCLTVDQWMSTSVDVPFESVCVWAFLFVFLAFCLAYTHLPGISGIPHMDQSTRVLSFSLIFVGPRNNNRFENHCLRGIG